MVRPKSNRRPDVVAIVLSFSKVSQTHKSIRKVTSKRKGVTLKRSRSEEVGDHPPLLLSEKSFLDPGGFSHEDRKKKKKTK